MKPSSRSKLLPAGAISGIVFYGLFLIQAMYRSDFDIRTDGISLLSLGPHGWVQVLNFVLTGLLLLAGAVGLRGSLRGHSGGTWAPILVGVFGIGMIAAGAFPTDTPEQFEAGEHSTAGMLHSMAFMVGFLGLTVACFVFARMWATHGFKQRSVACWIVGASVPILIGIGSSIQSIASIVFAVMAVAPFVVLAMTMLWARNPQANPGIS